MKLQQLIRFTFLCAALALCLGGAWFYRLPSVAGQTAQPATLHGAAALDQLKQDGQYDALQAAVNQARFNVKRTTQTPLGRAAWHAPNPAAGYDAYVTEAGVSIAIRGAVNDQSFVSLHLHSLGYGKALQSVAPGEVSGDQQTINLAHEGGVQEWYVNGPDGLEQGFTLSEPPGARYPGVPLRLAIQVSEGWRAVAGEDGKRVTLRGPQDEAIEYGKLAVTDSEGRNISARLTVADALVAIEVEDAEAAYPLTIDPLFTLQQRLTAADGAANDYLGQAVALSGNTAVIGAPYDVVTQPEQGSAYVFVRGGAAQPVWTLQQKLTAGDGAASDFFGLAVGVNGDTVVVGAPGDDNGAQTDQGSAYVFTRNGTVWTQQQKLTANDGAAGDFFGLSVALSGDTVAVGTNGDDSGANVDQGSAYVFTYSGATWTLQQKLIANDGAAVDNFGLSVALSGDTVVVGANRDDIGTNPDQGSAYVFTRSGATQPVWTQQQKLTAGDSAAGDYFGYAVAVSGDTLAVAAPLDAIGANTAQGSVYVFTRNGTAWVQSQKLTAADGAANDTFGAAVALSNGTLVAGAPHDTIGANIQQGSAYFFTFAGGWFQQQKLTGGGGGAGYYLFGQAVALSGDTLVAGAPGDRLGANINQGSAYVFTNPTCPALTLAPASLPNGVSGALYQQQMSVSGGAGPFQFALSGGALPPGLTLSPGGLLAGTPSAPGAYHFTLRAANSNLCSTSRAYTLTIAPPCPSLTLYPATLANGATGTPYSETLFVKGGREPYTFRLKGALPPELSLSADGSLSGTPTLAGSFDFIALVSDANGCAGSRAYTLTISPAAARRGK